MMRHGLAVLLLSLLTASLFVSCDEGLAECRLPCERDEDCQLGGAGLERSRCVDQRCFFVQCEADEECAAGEGCVDLPQGRGCVQLCSADGSCPSQWDSCFDSKDGRSVCLEDCRKIGCIEEEECDEDTGNCYCEDDSGCFGGICE